MVARMFAWVTPGFANPGVRSGFGYAQTGPALPTRLAVDGREIEAVFNHHAESRIRIAKITPATPTWYRFKRVAQGRSAFISTSACARHLAHRFRCSLTLACWAYQVFSKP